MIKRLFTAVVFMAMFYPIYAEEVADSAAQARHELQEIVVEAARIIHKPGVDVLMLSDRNREFGVNALEAILNTPIIRTHLC